MRTAISVILFGILAGSVSAQANGQLADSDSIEMWRILASRGTPSPEALRSQVREKLLAEHRIPYRFQRVELAGVGSTDDTDATLPGMVDMQLKTSHLHETLPEDQRIVDYFSIVRRLTDAKNKVYALLGMDARESFSNTRGIPSPRSEKIIAQLKGATINELFAHSWGTEVVYLGILNGDIIPPKKLVIMGVPESNEEKWRLLAAYTGIEVHVIGFEWDKARMLGDAALKFKSGLPEDTTKLRKLWDKKCGARIGSAAACSDPDKFVPMKFDYNLHVRPPNVPEDKFIKGSLFAKDHDRSLYYTYLSKRKLFNKTVAELDAPQLKVIKAEEDKILAEALAEARAMIAESNAAAREAAEIEERGRKEFWPKDPAEMARLRERLRELKNLGNTGNPPVQPVTPIGVPVTNFLQILPQLRELAVASCRSPGQVTIDADITLPVKNIFFHPQADDAEITRLSSGLGVCERQLFLRLTDVVRAGQGEQLTLRWLEDTTRFFIPPPSYDQTYVPPREEPRQPRGPGCSPENGVWGCPK